MSYPKGSAKLQVRIPQQVKAELEARAAQVGMNLGDYIRQNVHQLLSEHKIQIDDPRMSVPNPYRPYSPAGFQTQPGYPYNPYMQQPDALDQMVNEMRKLVMVQMMMKLLQGQTSAERFVQAYRGQHDGNGGGLDFNKMMQWQMLQQQQDRSYDRQQAQHERQMMSAMQQLENARRTGDKPGESKAMELITALIAAQGTQSSQWLQQFMAQQQSQQAQQSNFFQAAMSVNKDQSAAARQSDREYDAKLETIRNQFFTSQNAMNTQLWQQQIGFLNQEMQRIRDDKTKGPLTQIAELLKMRDESPVYKAAFDAAFGVKNESMIGQLIPQLKELGVDKLADRVGTFLIDLVKKPRVPAPGPVGLPPPAPLIPPPGGLPVPSPLQQMTGGQPPTIIEIPAPAPNTPLENLSLPPATSNTPKPEKEPQFTATPKPPAAVTKMQPPQTPKLPENAIGYSNLDSHKKTAPKKTKTAKPPT